MNNKKSYNYGIISLLVAIFAIICSVAYIVCRVISDRNYNEKWKEYDGYGEDCFVNQNYNTPSN